MHHQGLLALQPRKREARGAWAILMPRMQEVLERQRAVEDELNEMRQQLEMGHSAASGSSRHRSTAIAATIQCPFSGLRGISAQQLQLGLTSLGVAAAAVCLWSLYLTWARSGEAKHASGKSPPTFMCKVVSSKKVAVLADPAVDAEVIDYLLPGTQFLATHRVIPADSRTYFQMAERCGWVPECSRKDQLRAIVKVEKPSVRF
eukprot:TRINITY_DN32812_c0_g1_i3.p1 TRINITY_DN32812_c0_g1~~TRINITY_DN32812_c0_g1_i3.p1  ORF type:complete len:204 (-),score=45.24 TRINITY_DN32812_c0_g1_i3:30-641(-)